jgi:hypothetical protein
MTIAKCQFILGGDMARNWLRTLVFIATLTFSLTARASGDYDGFTITIFQVHPGHPYLQIAHSTGTGNNNPDSCTAGGARFLISYTNDTPERARTMVATAMMAFAMGKTINVTLNGCAPGQTVPTTYAVIRRIEVLP